jgi:L-ascorbate metabolism protein UlaG (beta-lactamase superfamily)
MMLACTPARHFSGRSLFDRNKTLWCSWVITGQHTRVFFSGDGGYGPHFEQIGKKYGSFDLTLMECGQYDERWSDIHMLPEQTVQAHIDVKGNSMIPIHWAAFCLAFHAWTDPVERVIKAAKERKVNIITPKIGESVIVGSAEYPVSTWWR